MSFMIPVNSLRNGVILSSIILLSLLLWLSTSFLFVAYKASHDAEYLDKHLNNDAIFRDASVALAEERTLSYWLTGIDELFFAGESLIKLRANTDEAMILALTVLDEITNDAEYSGQLRFKTEHLTKLSLTLQKQVVGLKEKRHAFAQGLKYPSKLRDENLQLEILDYYQKVIDQLQLIRHGFGYVSSDHSRETQNIFAVSNAAWNIRLSNHLLAPLFEGYITAGSTALGDARTQATALLSRMEENLKTIQQVPAYANIDSQLHVLALELTNWYSENYIRPTRHLVWALANNTPTSYTNNDWRKISGDLAEHTTSMLMRADEVSRLHVADASKRTTRNLIIDYGLVILCFVLMAWATWVVRRLHHQAMHDELTDLPNRHQLKVSCDELIESSDESSPVSLLKIDLHKFRAINDRFGQLAGDKLLQEVARRLRGTVAPNTLVSAMGGNEYAVLLKDADESAAKSTAQKLLQCLSAEFHIDEQPVQLNSCIGFACFPHDAGCSEELRKSADLALFGAKQSGAGTITPYDASIAKSFKERQVMEAELRVALARDEFELHYQPQFDLEHCAVSGVEALIRWRHPQRGMIPPGLFIPVAEEAGLLPSIGKWIIYEAAAQSTRWKNDHGIELRMSVNVSTHQFLHGDVVQTIESALSREALDPSAFEIEITESVAMADINSVIETLNTLHDLGIRIALDDFGTGYSSLSYLQDLPLDTLKIDRSFIIKVDNGPVSQQPLLESIASMAKLLNFHTVAEGVETDAQLNLVRALGLDTVQGYYYSKPVTGKQLPDDVNAINAAHGHLAARAA